MKIIRFNESNISDKFVKITFGGERTVSIEDIEGTEAYQRYMDKKSYDNYIDRRQNAIWFGAEQFINENGLGGFSTELVDFNGDKIEDEELFDSTKKYNL